MQGYQHVPWQGGTDMFYIPNDWDPSLPPQAANPIYGPPPPRTTLWRPQLGLIGFWLRQFDHSAGGPVVWRGAPRLT